MFKVTKHEGGLFTVYRTNDRGARCREYVAIRVDKHEAKRLIREYKEQVKDRGFGPA